MLRARELATSIPLIQPLVISLKNRVIKYDGDPSYPPPREAEVIHGHFRADRFDGLTRPIRLITVLRDPLERAISHYMYYKKNNGLPNQRINIPYAPNLTFLDFAYLPELINFQSKCLGNKKPEDFAVIGTAENLPLFYEQLSTQEIIPNYRDGYDPAIHLRRTMFKPTHAQLGIEKSDIEKFKQIHSEDYDLYESPYVLR